MTPLRILHAVFSSRIAGSERYCVDLANRQAALGHEVHVAGMRRSPIAAALAPGVTFHGCGSRLLRRFFLWRLVARLSPDVCHGHLSAACKALGGLSAGTRSVATLHVGYKAHQHGKLGGLICVNRAQAAKLSDYRGTARTIPNWLPEVPAGPAGPGLREELQLGPEVFLVGGIGRLHPSKGMDLLIRAFRASAPANAALVILGEGPQRPELESLAAGDSRIHLPGHRSNVYDCLHDLDLFVSPSREESFGLAIIEAMSAGLPVIATEVEGPGEYLLDQPVVLVPPDSVDALAESLASAAAIFADVGLPRIAYDLQAFEPVERVGDVLDFYSHVVAGRGVREASVVETVAVPT